MKKVEIIMVQVADQQKAKDFYLKIGFQLIMEAPAAHGETWIQLGFPKQDTTIALAKFQGIICQTDNINNEIKELKTKGIEVGKIDETPWGKFAWFKDLDGNSLCLHQK